MGHTRIEKAETGKLLDMVDTASLTERERSWGT